MSALVKIMNKEIQKYQGRIYYLDMRTGNYVHNFAPRIEPAEWIVDTKSYNHYSFELHHVIKFTHYEQNKNWYQERGLNMCLILIPKVMHQHLENPEFELTNEKFFEKYKIQKYELLFNKKDYACGNFPAILKKAATHISFDDVDLSCLDEINLKEVCCG